MILWSFNLEYDFHDQKLISCYGHELLLPASIKKGLVFQWHILISDWNVIQKRWKSLTGWMTAESNICLDKHDSY